MYFPVILFFIQIDILISEEKKSFYRLVGCCKGDEHSGIECTFNIGIDDNVEIVCHEGEQDSSICGDLHGLCWR